MKISDQFQVLTGRLTGYKHIREGGCCQDYVAHKFTDDGLFMFHSDGVGSCQFSEMGSCFMVNMGMLIVPEILPRFDSSLKSGDEKSITAFLEEVRQRMLHKLMKMAMALTGEAAPNHVIRAAAKKYLQATFSMAVITNNYSLAAHVGDGYHLINGEEKILDDQVATDTGVGPVCLIHGLMSKEDLKDAELNTNLKPTVFMPTDQVDELLIGGDGIVKFNESADRELPRNLDVSPQGDIFQFRDPRYMKNPSLVQRRFCLLSIRNEVWPDDDTAFCWARRRP